MSIQNSYLSQKDENGQKVYNADMVAAISEKSLNSQMRLYLSSCDLETRVYFLQIMNEKGVNIKFMLQKGTDESKIPAEFKLAETVEELKKQNSSIYNELEKLDLFNIETGTSMRDDERIVKAMKYCFSYGLHLADGIPDEVMKYIVSNIGKVDVDEKLNILTLDKDSKSVIFNQFFKTFEVIQINSSMRPPSVKLMKVAQDCSGDDPIKSMWRTQSSMPINFRASSFENIKDEEVKNNIKKMADVPDPDTVFDISQLMLDLSQLQTLRLPSIEGVSPDVESTVSGVVGEYFDRLEKGGQTVFGVAVASKPNSNQPVKYLFTPRTRNYDMGDHTLYYLMNFEDHHDYTIPSLNKRCDFDWAPLLDGSVIADGVMAISATKFIPLICEKMESLLPKLIMTKHPYVDAGFCKYEVKWDEPEVPQDQHFKEGKELWLTEWHYSQEYNQDYQLLWGPLPVPIPPFVSVLASGKICSKYSVDCYGQPGTFTKNGVTYPTYDFNFHFKGWMNYGYNSQSNSGDYYDQNVLFQVVIKINASGELQFSQHVDRIDNHPSGIDVHGWGDFCSLGQLQGTVDDMCKSMSEMIDVLKDDVVSKFMNGVATFTGWFMPGQGAYTFKNEGISKNGDLYSYINYVQENG